MTLTFRLPVQLLGVLAWLWSALLWAAPVSATAPPNQALGQSIQYWQETGAAPDLAQAVARYQSGQFTPGHTPVLNFGIGAPPVWLHLAVDNTAAQPVVRRLLIETAWLDRIDVYVRQQGKTLTTYQMGDAQAYAQRPVNSRYFAFDYAYPAGVSDVYLRIATPDPMVVPIYLMLPSAAQHREVIQECSYGILYGFLFALIAYNAVLFASLHSRRFLYYALYLATFMAMNLTYTGHGFAWFWPDALRWQAWSHPILMYAYTLSGLLFATRFLDTRDNFPRLHQGVVLLIAGFGALLAVAIVLDHQAAALLIAFVFVIVFTLSMVGLGAIAMHAGLRPARYFLLGALAAMSGAITTALATWGFIPYTVWTFRAVEIGMMFDATILALALSYQFRVGEAKRIRAEQLAQLDPLTGLNNRRAFYDRTAALWHSSLRNGSPSCVIAIDIDHFKDINDRNGHAHGDKVLVAMAALLREKIRQGDVLARWGGEEFILYLPDTPLHEASLLAERLRAAIANAPMPEQAENLSITVSLGVAQKRPEHDTLDTLINHADHNLYQSKALGRNRVTAD